MRKTLLCIFCTLWFASSQAVDYCASSSWGYAGSSVTGGGNATPTIVTNETELTNALKKSNTVIIITQDITVTSHISTDKSNLTIMALPGKKLISEEQNKANSGILYLKGNNLLLRNLTFEGPGAYDCDGWDNLCLDKATNVWVDHCDFQDGCDGNFDIKSLSDNITVSWCRFRYLKAPKAGGSGGSDDHRFSNLIGSSSSDAPSDGTYNVTYAYCWWDEGCKQRMTRCRNAELHFLNCYWNSSVSDYYIGPENASCYFEGCTFAGRANSIDNIWSEFNGSTNYCKFVNCTGNLPSNSGVVAAPDYTYDHLTAAKALTYTTNATCGAGATLTVTTSAALSSSCPAEEDEPQVLAGDTVTENTFWNISDEAFNALGTISAETTVNHLHIMATSDATMAVDANNKSVDGLSFTHRLKLSGTGSEAARHIWFNVAGSCTVDIYLTSASGSEARTLNIATGTFDNIVTTKPATNGSVTKESFPYIGDATTIYLYSQKSGINIYGIRVTYTSDPTAITNAKANAKANKVLHNGQVLIERDGHVYNLLGTLLR